MIETTFSYEQAANTQGFRRIAGVDEAGRGPLAGPVVAAACILPLSLSIVGLNDSKQLKAHEREALFKQLTTHPDISFGIGIVSAEEIDRLNILQASLKAMLLAVEQIDPLPDYLLIDGIHAPKTTLPCETIVQGDALSLSIAAASILAKVTRDRIMVALHETHPQYGFDAHKGYATHTHLLAIHEHGPGPAHRKTFEPIKSLLIPELPLGIF